MIDDDLVRAHRARALSPERPVVRGTAHNADTFFQARETANPFYARVPAIVQQQMDRFADLTGRQYHLFDYYGAPDADRVAVMMGSGTETAHATATALNERGERVGVLQVRLYRPFAAEAFLAALPRSVRAVAVLEQTKESGAPGEPLYLDVVNTLAQATSRGRRRSMPLVIGGRYGLSSKDFNPSMAKAVFDELRKPEPRDSFTVGIIDDVTHTSLTPDAAFRIEPNDLVQAVFYGLGADGTVGANKNSVKIIAEDAGLHAQGYFVYDSHKSGAQTISHLRFGPRPIHAPYLIQQAGFVGCHQFQFVARHDVLRLAAPGATVLLNAPYGPARFGTTCRARCNCASSSWDCGCSSSTPRASRRTSDCAAAPTRCCRPASSRSRACCRANRRSATSRRRSARATAARARRWCRRTSARWTRRSSGCSRSRCRRRPPACSTARPSVPDHAPAFVRTVTAAMLEGRGDEIPVSQLPVDGTWPSGTAVWEKRNIADAVPVWDATTCIQCGQCSFVCPHGVIQARYFDRARLSRCAGELPFGADQCARLSRCALRPRLRDRGLHGMRAVRGGLPGGAAEVARHAGQGPAADGRACGQRILRRSAGERPRARGLRQCSRRAVPRAAVHLLGRLRRLRRDAVSEAAVAAVRRPACRSPMPPAARRSMAATCR